MPKAAKDPAKGPAKGSTKAQGKDQGEASNPARGPAKASSQANAQSKAPAKAPAKAPTPAKTPTPAKAPTQPKAPPPPPTPAQRRSRAQLTETTSNITLHTTIHPLTYTYLHLQLHIPLPANHIPIRLPAFPVHKLRRTPAQRDPAELARLFPNTVDRLPLDMLTVHKHLTSALTHYLGAHGKGVDFDFLKLDIVEYDFWIRVARENWDVVVAACAGWVGAEGERIMVAGRGEWLGGVVGQQLVRARVWGGAEVG